MVLIFYIYIETKLYVFFALPRAKFELSINVL